MRDYIEALLAGLEEEEPSEETAELETGPAVIRLEEREWEQPGSGGSSTSGRAEDAAKAAAPPAGADAPAETAGGRDRAEVEEGSGAEALLPGLTDTAAAVRRAAGREDGPPPAGVREAAERAGAVGGLLRRLETSGGAAAPALLGDGGDSPAGGGRPSGAAWLAEQVGRSLRPAVEQTGRSGGSVTVIRPAERGGGTVEAEGLDRMFRRDARRYDGGFQLL